jgi:hypothetical protein
MLDGVVGCSQARWCSNSAQGECRPFGDRLSRWICLVEVFPSIVADDRPHFASYFPCLNAQWTPIIALNRALRKTSHLLLGLSRLVTSPAFPVPITYYALDLEERELERTLGEIHESELGKSLKGRVDTKGMWGTYDGGLKFIAEGGLQYPNIHLSNGISPGTVELGDFDRVIIESSPISCVSTISDLTASDDISDRESPPTTPDCNYERPPLHIFFLGSTLGNFSRQESVEFLRSLPLLPGSGDTLLIGLDHDNDKDLIEEAYNDHKGYTRKFIMNGLKAAGRVLGDEDMFDENKWEYFNTYNIEERTLSYHRLTYALHLLNFQVVTRHTSSLNVPRRSQFRLANARYLFSSMSSSRLKSLTKSV